jgi:ABC-type dipeptide/oligopeptide/nickel transport system permease subunit
VIGTLWGAIAGLAGGIVDGSMMRFVDILLSIPLLFVVLVLATKYSATVVRREPADRPVLVAGSRRAWCAARC